MYVSKRCPSHTLYCSLFEYFDMPRLHLLREFLFPLPSSRLSFHFPSIPICLRHFSSPSLKSNGFPSPVIHEFLEKLCGLSHAEAIKTSKYLCHLKTIENPKKVVGLFRERGFTDAHIKCIVRYRPRVLNSSIPNTLQPKFKLIEDLGTEDGELGLIISKIPRILEWNIERTIAPGIALLRKLVKSDKNVITVLKRLPLKFFSFEKLKASLLFLEKNGIDEIQAGHILLKNPSIFTSAEAHITKLFDTVEKLGVLRNSSAFSSAVAIMGSSSKDKLERKISFLVSIGLSKKEVLEIVAKFPSVFTYSEKKLKCHMDFVVNILNLEPSIISYYPTFLGFSMENRILPRYQVFQTLQSMGIMKTKVGFFSILAISDKDFLDRFVKKHNLKSSRLYKIYKGMDPDIPSVNEGNISAMESQ